MLQTLIASAEDSESMGPTISSLFVFVPIICLTVSAIATIVFFRKHSSDYDEYLKGKVDRRNTFRWLFLGLVPLVGAAAIDWGDLTELLYSKGDIVDLVCISVACALTPIWIGAQVIEARYGDNRTENIKKLEKNLEEEKGRVQATREKRNLYIQLNSLARQVVGKKGDRVKKLIKSVASQNGDASQGAVLDTIEKTLNPEEQIMLMITFLQLHLERQARQRIADSKVRVAYYEVIDGELSLSNAYDGSSYTCIRSAGNLDHHYRIADTNEPTNLAMSAIKRGKPYVIPITADAHNDAHVPFTFYTEEQRKYLKSIAVMPIKASDENPPIRHIICMDTDQEGFFGGFIGEKDLGTIIEAITLRLLFEVDVRALLATLRSPCDESEGTGNDPSTT